MWLKRLRLVQRRIVLCPTFFGSFCAVALLVSPIAWWCRFGESFLCLTERLPAEVLVVEGWIGRAGVRAAAAEFERGSYRYVVTTGGLTDAKGWMEPGWSYARGAADELLRLGVPQDRIIVAPTADVESQRTYNSAVAARKVLDSLEIRPPALSVFTLGSHARRSRLVYAKIEGPGTKVGVISWVPSGEKAGPWWRSSDRAKALLTETACYVYEALLNTGRGSNNRQEAWHHPLKPLSIFCQGPNAAKLK
jgi:hypothetical protein